MTHTPVAHPMRIGFHKGMGERFMTHTTAAHPKNIAFHLPAFFCKKTRQARLARFDKAVGGFILRHPYLSLLFFYTALPLGMLGFVYLCAAAVVVPLAYFTSWVSAF